MKTFFPALVVALFVGCSGLSVRPDAMEKLTLKYELDEVRSFEFERKHQKVAGKILRGEGTLAEKEEVSLSHFDALVKDVIHLMDETSESEPKQHCRHVFEIEIQTQQGPVTRRGCRDEKSVRLSAIIKRAEFLILN